MGKTTTTKQEMETIGAKLKKEILSFRRLDLADDGDFTTAELKTVIGHINLVCDLAARRMCELKEKDIKNKGISSALELTLHNAIENADKLSNLLKMTDEFYSKDGEGYRLTVEILEKYRDFKFLKKLFWENATLFDDVSIVEVIKKENGKTKMMVHLENKDNEHLTKDMSAAELNKYIIRHKANIKQAGNNKKYSYSQADIFFMSCMGDDDGSQAAKAIERFRSSRQMVYTTSLIEIVEQNIERMQNADSKKMQAYGNLLHYLYIETPHEEKDQAEIIDDLGYKKNTFYKDKEAAIATLGKSMFGITPGEYGTAKIFISDDGRFIFDDYMEV